MDLIAAKKSMPDEGGSVVGISLNCDLGQDYQIADQLNGLQNIVDSGLLTGPEDENAARDIAIACPQAISNYKMTLPQVVKVVIEMQKIFIKAGLKIPVGIAEEKQVLMALQDQVCNNGVIQGYIAMIRPFWDGGLPADEGSVLESAINDLHGVLAEPACDNFWFRLIETARPVIAGDSNFTEELAAQYALMAHTVQTSSMAAGTSNGIVWHKSHMACWELGFDGGADFSTYTCDCSTDTGCDELSDLTCRAPLCSLFMCQPGD